MSKEAMTLALEALKVEHSAIYGSSQTARAIKALEEALAKQEQGEPVAWQWLNTSHFRKKLPKDAEKGAWNPLYTTPQPAQKPWVGLTDEERKQIHDEWRHKACLRAWGYEEAIEAKLKEKNNV